VRLIFLTVTDAAFFPGTVATLNTVRAFHPEARVVAVNNHLHKAGLTDRQRALLAAGGVEVIEARALDRPGRKLAAWELKAYAAADLTAGEEVLLGIDSDCVLCGRMDDVIAAAVETGDFHGGRDAAPAYNDAYLAYGIETPARNGNYMSTSLYTCALTPENRAMLARWGECCDRAIFGGGQVYPGHGDQGVLNAVLYAARGAASARVLDNRLWSQHGCYWQGPLELREGRLWNLAAEAPQRALHCGGAEKFWTKTHLDKVQGRGTTAVNYAWYLAALWHGQIRLEPEDMSSAQPHLVESYVRYRELIGQLADRAVLTGAASAEEVGTDLAGHYPSGG